MSKHYNISQDQNITQFNNWEDYLVPSLGYDILKNKLGIIDEKELEVFERKKTETGEGFVRSKSFSASFDVHGLKQIHHSLFNEVYEWAGQFRTVDMTKGDQEDIFSSAAMIETHINEVFSNMPSEQKFKSMTIDEFSDAAADLLVEINNVHPFREGNGRTQRAMVRKIADNYGYKVTFEGVTQMRMIDACVESRAGNLETMRELLKELMCKNPSSCLHF